MFCTVMPTAYFGAFYAAEDNDASFYTYSYHILSVAKAVAKRGCEAHAGGPCAFYAVAVPKGTDPNAQNLDGLGAITGDAFTTAFRV
ncbi:MAG: hypothetical protein AAF755_12670 [Pseudomonadota bacterium]